MAIGVGFDDSDGTTGWFTGTPVIGDLDGIDPSPAPGGTAISLVGPAPTNVPAGWWRTSSRQQEALSDPDTQDGSDYVTTGPAMDGTLQTVAAPVVGAVSSVKRSPNKLFYVIVAIVLVWWFLER